MRIVAPSAENLRRAAALLRAGQLVGMPTETVYGLAGNALDPAALTRIFSTKERPTFDPLIVHLPESVKGPLDLLSAWVDLATVAPKARIIIEALIAAFWPGPLTLVLPKTVAVPDLATSGLATVALRMPRHPVAQALLAETGFPLAAPSANRFGRISPTTAAHVDEELGDRLELTLDGGACEIGLESTVVAIDPATGGLLLLRPGRVSAADLERVAGVKPAAGATPTPGMAASAPGMLASHYAPSKPLRLLPATVARLVGPPAGPLPARLGLLVQAGDATGAGDAFARLTGREVIARTLSRSGSLEEAARNLFAELRELDHSAADLLFAEPVTTPEEGLGHAIADRLRRASAGAESVRRKP